MRPSLQHRAQRSGSNLLCKIELLQIIITKLIANCFVVVSIGLEFCFTMTVQNTT